MKRLVLIDDEDDIREVLKHSIEYTKDWTVQDAAGGEAGLELVRRVHPDAVLLDVMMPDMDGREVFRRLRRDPETEGLPVIFITASLQKNEIRELEELRPAGVLAKPFDPLTIADEIAGILGW